MSTSGEVAIRVRYAETDRMGLLHHANYLVYFEQARTELLRAQGVSYKDLEDQGFLLVLTRVTLTGAVSGLLSPLAERSFSNAMTRSRARRVVCPSASEKFSVSTACALAGMVLSA